MSKNLHHNGTQPGHADPHDLTEPDILDLLTHGEFADWRPLLTALDQEPHGPVATKLEHILARVDAPGVAEFFQIKLNKSRGAPLDNIVAVPWTAEFWDTAVELDPPIRAEPTVR